MLGSKLNLQQAADASSQLVASSGVSPSLGALLFGEEKASAAHAPGAANSVGPRTLEPWPTCVPGLERTFQILSGELEARDLIQVSRSVLGSLTELESNALFSSDDSAVVVALRQSILVRWRIAAAFHLKPSDVSKMDNAALDQLFSQADEILAKLLVPPEADPTFKSSVESARASIAKGVSELLAWVTQPQSGKDEDARAAAKALASKYQKMAKLVSIATAKETAPKKSKALYILLAITALGTGAFHAYQFHKGRSQAASVPGVPSGMHAFMDPRTGIVMIPPLPGNNTNAGKIAEMKALAKASNRTVREVAPGAFIVLPADVKAPRDSSGR